jgi:hypothetical protein
MKKNRDEMLRRNRGSRNTSQNSSVDIELEESEWSPALGEERKEGSHAKIFPSSSDPAGRVL